MEDKPKTRNDIPKIETANNAASSLRAVESGATEKKPEETGDNLVSTRANEQSASGFYTGGGVQLSLTGKKSFWKRKGPIGAIVALVLGVGFLAAGTQFFQPFAFVEQIRVVFNSMHVSTHDRSDAFLKMQLGSGKYANPIKGSVFSNSTFKITEKQQARLAKQGIEVTEQGGHTVLKFDDGTGKPKIVTADARTASELGGDAIDFKTIYAKNPDFANGYNQSSMTWRGHIANWFGSVTAKFLSKNRITRNMFKDFIEKVKASESGNTRTYAVEKMADGTDSIDEPGAKLATKQDEYEFETEVGEDGKIRYVRDEYGNPKKIWAGDHYSEPANSGKGKISRADIKANPDLVSDIVKNVEKKFSGANKLVGGAQSIVNVTCTAVNFFGAISLLASAAEALQIIGLISGYTEAVDKVKAGYADDSPINDLADALNERHENTHTVVSGRSSKETTTNKTAMESQGMSFLFQGTKIKTDDESVKTFNVSSNVLSVANSIEAFESCMIAKVAVNAASSAIQIAKIATCLGGLTMAAFTFGASFAGCLPLLGDIGTTILSGTLVSLGLAAITAFVTPILTNILTRDLIEDLGGEDLGNALVSGGNMILGNNHRSNGGSLATRSEYTQFVAAQQQVIADNARFERMNRSPFDITSQYTFLGSLLNKLISFSSVNSVMSAVSTSTNVVSSSIASVLPTATATTISASLPDEDEYRETCPYLASIGAIGDAFCNPYAVTDMDTIDEDPAQVINMIGADQFKDETTSDGNVIIAGDSDLAKYLLYCNNRESTFGLADQNIVNELQTWGTVKTKNSKINAVANAAISSLPVFGDFIDIFQSAEALANVDYISGSACVARNGQEESTEDWGMRKYYQRFFEDQSLAETMGIIEKSAATAFLEEYYEEHPLDNTYEGILARYSGLTKDQVVAALNFIEYADYIADYDPSTRMHFGEPEAKKSDEIFFETENFVGDNTYVVLMNEISFADVRNRSFVV